MINIQFRFGFSNAFRYDIYNLFFFYNLFLDNRFNFCESYKQNSLKSQGNVNYIYKVRFGNSTTFNGYLKVRFDNLLYFPIILIFCSGISVSFWYLGFLFR